VIDERIGVSRFGGDGSGRAMDLLGWNTPAPIDGCNHRKGMKGHWHD
jgi:hypothetical protein